MRHMLIFSEVDYVTPLCSQVTYEGLLDDMFGIHAGSFKLFVTLLLHSQ